MRRRNLIVLVLLALGLTLSVGFTSWAHPWGMKRHQGWHHGRFANLTPEQTGQLFDLRQKFLDDTASLRREKVVKKAELKALWRSDNPDEKQILAKAKELNAIKAKLLEKAIPFRLQVRKIIPKGSGHKGRVSMEEEDMDLGPTMAMKSPGNIGY